MCLLMRNFSLLSLEKEGATGCFGVSSLTKNPRPVDKECCRNRSVRICVLFSNEVPYSNCDLLHLRMHE